MQIVSSFVPHRTKFSTAKRSALPWQADGLSDYVTLLANSPACVSHGRRCGCSALEYEVCGSINRPFWLRSGAHLKQLLDEARTSARPWTLGTRDGLWQPRSIKIPCVGQGNIRPASGPPAHLLGRCPAPPMTPKLDVVQHELWRGPALFELSSTTSARMSILRHDCPHRVVTCARPGWL